MNAPFEPVKDPPAAPSARRRTERSWYGVAILAPVAAAAVRLAFLQVLGTRASFVTFYPAVMVAALYGGFWAGLVATVLSAGLAAYFWLEPAKEWAIKSTADWLALAIFLISCAMISWITEALRRARARAQDAEAEAEIIATHQRDQEALRETEERSKEALRESETKYRTLFENMTEEVHFWEVVRDPEGQVKTWRIVDANPPALRAWGKKSLAEIQGKTTEEIFGPGATQHYLPVVQKIMAEGRPHSFEDYFPNLDKHFRFTSVPLGEYFITTGSDVTERKRTEEQLRELSQRLTYHVDHSPLAVIEWGSDMRLTRWSQAAERVFGWKAEEVLGKRMEDFRWIYQEDQLRVAAVSADLQTGANTHLFSANRNYRKDGSVAYCEWYNSSLVDESGQLRSILSLVLDVTERKQAEDRIQASLREKEVLLKEIHHRVKNNLQVISSLVDLQADGLGDSALRAVFADVRDRIRSMALVHEKLYQSESLARVDFAEYTRSLLHYLWRAYGSRAGNVRLTLDLQPVLMSVDQAVPCGLILNELAANALKHAFRDRSAGEVIVHLQTGPDESVRLRVSDNGRGLPSDFDWQQSRSMGLRLVRMLTEQLDGTLQLSSKGGTQFEIAFVQAKTQKQSR